MVRKYYSLMAAAWLPLEDCADAPAKDGTDMRMAMLRRLASRAILRSPKRTDTQRLALTALAEFRPVHFWLNLPRQALFVAGIMLQRATRVRRLLRDGEAFQRKCAARRKLARKRKPLPPAKPPGLPQWVFDRDEKILELRLKEKLTFKEIRARMDLRSRSEAETFFNRACRRRRNAGLTKGLPRNRRMDFEGFIRAIEYYKCQESEPEMTPTQSTTGGSHDH